MMTPKGSKIVEWKEFMLLLVIVFEKIIENEENTKTHVFNIQKRYKEINILIMTKFINIL